MDSGDGGCRDGRRPAGAGEGPGRHPAAGGRLTGDYADLAELAGTRARERWEGMTVAGRRRLLEKLRVRVTIRRTGKRGPGFDPNGVQIDRV